MEGYLPCIFFGDKAEICIAFLSNHCYSLDSLVQRWAHGRLLVISKATLRTVQG